MSMKVHPSCLGNPRKSALATCGGRGWAGKSPRSLKLVLLLPAAGGGFDHAVAHARLHTVGSGRKLRRTRGLRPNNVDILTLSVICCTICTELARLSGVPSLHASAFACPRWAHRRLRRFPLHGEMHWLLWDGRM